MVQSTEFTEVDRQCKQIAEAIVKAKKAIGSKIARQILDGHAEGKYHAVDMYTYRQVITGNLHVGDIPETEEMMRLYEMNRLYPR